MSHDMLVVKASELAVDKMGAAFANLSELRYCGGLGIEQSKLLVKAITDLEEAKEWIQAIPKINK